MRIAAISDIHVRNEGQDDELLYEIKGQVEQIDPDIFIIAGDTSERLTILGDSLSKLKIDGLTSLYVAGNHDIWFEENKRDSLEKYSSAIQEVCTQNGFIHLPDQPYIEGDLAVVGSIGWSDYSFRRQDLRIPFEAYKKKEYGGAIWYDVFNIDWHLTDIEITELLNKKLEYDLSTLPADVRRIIYVSHHLPFKELTLYKGRLPWDFFSAYMGAVSTGEILRRDPRVILSISGHSHVRNVVTVGHITAITVPLGYGRPTDGNYKPLVEKAVAHIELDDREIELVKFFTGDICEGLPYSMDIPD